MSLGQAYSSTAIAAIDNASAILKQIHQLAVLAQTEVTATQIMRL